MSKIQGGTFKEGFIASAFAASLKNINRDIWGTELKNRPYRVLTAAAIGGTTSVLGGGKFTNGAASAAFTQMFNAEATMEKERAKFKAGFEISKGPLKGAVSVNDSGDLSATGAYSALSMDSTGQASAAVGNANASYNIIDDLKSFGGDVLKFFTLKGNSDGNVEFGGHAGSKSLGFKIEASFEVAPYAILEQSEVGQDLNYKKREQRINCAVNGDRNC
ncbi:hypothetical protein [Amphritea pacifica]|uniref:Uncharacterized protein n=1 Tax=Amphritea pacifica TaxID=2811233 RepID=A0ABS2WE28_9GAMM|nr:hypothetical protein [Amphritea pacifica]MBN0989876.1 hypothetical protein [Amphritea pacifica]MBN1009191.1 hypothetical protein [Amphritea pacifica]